MTAPHFDYSNMSGRPAGPFLSTLSKVLPGVRAVQNQVAPFAAAWEAHNRAALAGVASDAKVPIWVSIGDSLTQGLGAPDFWKGWVGQTADLLTASGRPHRVVNLSTTGARVCDVIDRQLPALKALEDQGVVPSLITVLIGSNDLVLRKHRDNLPPNFESLLTLLPAGTIVSNLPNPRRAAHEMHQLIESAVSRQGLILANMRQPRTTKWRGKLASDHFHPNQLGYTGIAEIFYEAIPAA